MVNRIGLDGASIDHKTFVNESKEFKRRDIDIHDHAAGLREVSKLLTDSEIGVIRDPAEIEVVGHRVVHGGESFTDTIVINQEVKDKIKKLFPLAPLHNPPNYLGIEVAEKIFFNATQVAVFDTAFHQTMPPVAYRMAIPRELYEKDGIRAYGFHGTSHKYVAAKTAAWLKLEMHRLITIHLGNGCSICAIRDGKCVDTSMGLGPMNG